MSRLMSVAFTEQAVAERRKTVTRRKGWTFLKPGDQLTLCRKVMGRKRADGTVEPLVRLAQVEVVDVRRERLGRLLDEDGDGLLTAYARGEIVREGFPRMDPYDFVEKFFVTAQLIYPDHLVTRIEWRYLDQVRRLPTGYWSATCDHGKHLWYLERPTEHLARRSLDAHLKHQHGITRIASAS